MERQIRFCTSADGTRIAYAVLGQGPATPVITVSGWTWTIEAIMTQPAWIGQPARRQQTAMHFRVSPEEEEEEFQRGMQTFTDRRSPKFRSR